MKQNNKKHITNLLCGLTTISALSTASVVLSGCSHSQTTTIPESQLIIEDGVLKGLKSGTDLTPYTTLEVPSSVTSIVQSAFTDAFPQGGPIHTIIWGKNLKEVGSYAFDGCNGITTLDLSNINDDNINDIVLGNYIFGATENQPAYMNIIFTDKLSNASKKRLIAKLLIAGVPETCFAKRVNDQITASTEELTKETSSTAITEYSVKAQDESLGYTYTFVASATRTGGTEGVGVKINNVYTEKVFDTNASGYAVKVEAEIVNAKNNGDFVEYDVNLVAQRGDVVMWVQTISSHKLTYNSSLVPGQIKYRNLLNENFVPGAIAPTATNKDINEQSTIFFDAVASNPTILADDMQYGWMKLYQQVKDKVTPYPGTTKPIATVAVQNITVNKANKSFTFDASGQLSFQLQTKFYKLSEEWVTRTIKVSLLFKVHVANLAYTCAYNWDLAGLIDSYLLGKKSLIPDTTSGYTITPVVFGTVSIKDDDEAEQSYVYNAETVQFVAEEQTLEEKYQKLKQQIPYMFLVNDIYYLNSVSGYKPTIDTSKLVQTLKLSDPKALIPCAVDVPAGTTISVNLYGNKDETGNCPYSYTDWQNNVATIAFDASEVKATWHYNGFMIVKCVDDDTSQTLWAYRVEGIKITFEA